MRRTSSIDSPHDDVAALRRQLAEATRRAESLNRVVDSITTSSDLALQPLLTRIVESAVTLLDAMYGSIGLVVETDNGPVVRVAAIYKMPAHELGAEMPPGVGLAGRALRERRPLQLDRYGDLDQPTLPELADHAVIGMPIWWGDDMIGFFGIGTEPPRRFGEHDCETLALYARHAAIAIQNARLFEAERRRAARIAVINRIGRLIAGSLSLDRVFQTAVEAIGEQLQFAYVAAGVVAADDPDTLVLQAHAGVNAAAIPAGYRQSIHEGLVGAAARTRRRVLVNNVARDSLYLPRLGHPAIYAELTVPIIVNDRLLGVLNVESEHAIGDDDAEGIEVVADQLGIAMVNARLFEAQQRRAARVATLNQLGRMIAGSLDLDQILQTAVEAICTHLQYPNVALLLPDPDEPTTLVLRARGGIYAGARVGTYRHDVARGIIGLAARSQRQVLVDDVARDPRYIPVPDAPGMRSELAIPLVVGNRLLGVLNIESEGAIGGDDAEALAIMADHLGVAIDNARLVADLREALGVTRFLHATAERMSTAMSVEAVVEAYLEEVAARNRYACAIVLYELGDRGERIARATYGCWTPDGGLSPGGECAPYTPEALDPLLDAGQTVTIADARHDPRVAAQLRERRVREQRPALAMIPLLLRGQCLGVVILSARAGHEWHAADLEPYQATAVQLATAIESRRQHLLLAERGQQLAVLEERQRLARDLHDSVSQLIFSMTLIAQSLAPAWRRNPAEGEGRVNRLLELSQATLAEMRALLAELRPTETAAPPTGDTAAQTSLIRLRREGLVAALQAHAAGVARDGPRIDVATQGYVRQAPELEEAFYRIAQEALHNVVKHARARQVEMRLGIEGDETAVRLSVRDDGIGFTPPGAADARRGLGLTTMRERAEGLGGTAHVRAAPGQGTAVEVVLPRNDRVG